MLPEFVREYVKPVVQIIVGIYITRLAFRTTSGGPPDRNMSPYIRKLLKVAGPATILLGVLSLRTGGLRTPEVAAPAIWQRCATLDGTCSAEFPGTPQRDVPTTSGATVRRLALIRPDADYYFSLTDFDLPTDAPELTADEWIDELRDRMPEMGKALGMRYEFAGERRITTDGVPGREWEYEANGDHWLRVRTYIIGRRVYRLNATTPKGGKDDDEPRRFLESARFRDLPLRP
jgi:hypothetical protein